MKTFKIFFYCCDCTGVDFLGCFEGKIWGEAFFDNRKEAMKHGEEQLKDAPSCWFYKIVKNK